MLNYQRVFLEYGTNLSMFRHLNLKGKGPKKNGYDNRTGTRWQISKFWDTWDTLFWESVRNWRNASVARTQTKGRGVTSPCVNPSEQCRIANIQPGHRHSCQAENDICVYIYIYLHWINILKMNYPHKFLERAELFISPASADHPGCAGGFARSWLCCDLFPVRHLGLDPGWPWDDWSF